MVETAVEHLGFDAFGLQARLQRLEVLVERGRPEEALAKLDERLLCLMNRR